MSGSASIQALSKIALLGLPGVGPARAIQVAQTFGSLAEFRELCEERFDSDDSSVESAWQRAQRTIEHCEKLDITPVGHGDKAMYPDRLNAIKDPPPVLYVKGNSEPVHERVLVAIVGTREPTHYGQKAAKALGEKAAGDGIPVISGLALGCDTFGHKGCVEANGTAIAVMAHGLDHLYPKANLGLAHLIVETGGALVSEHPPGVKPTRWFFAKRDRLQSALSDIVIVVETGLKGGTQHTIRAALEQRRVLACVTPVKPLLGHEKVQGTLKLLKTGEAQPISESGQLSELVEEFLGDSALEVASESRFTAGPKVAPQMRTEEPTIVQGKLF
ncbi:MAG: DNA-protecting protein DprA [Chloroflexota bacterium]|nr:DNA-protecting protein DprA [Chloroflexota bacterium]